MKSYKVLSVKSTKEAENQMNEMAKQGWEVKAVTFWETAMSYQLVITFEREV